MTSTFLQSPHSKSRAQLQKQHTELTDHLRRSRWAQKLALERFTKSHRLAYLCEYNTLTRQLLEGIELLDTVEALLETKATNTTGNTLLRTCTRMGDECRRIVRSLVRPNLEVKRRATKKAAEYDK